MKKPAEPSGTVLPRPPPELKDSPDRWARVPMPEMSQTVTRVIAGCPTWQDVRGLIVGELVRFSAAVDSLGSLQSEDERLARVRALRARFAGVWAPYLAALQNRMPSDRLGQERDGSWSLAPARFYVQPLPCLDERIAKCADLNALCDVVRAVCKGHIDGLGLIESHFSSPYELPSSPEAFAGRDVKGLYLDMMGGIPQMIDAIEARVIAEAAGAGNGGAHAHVG